MLQVFNTKHISVCYVCRGTLYQRKLKDGDVLVRTQNDIVTLKLTSKSCDYVSKTDDVERLIRSKCISMTDFFFFKSCAEKT